MSRLSRQSDRSISRSRTSRKKKRNQQISRSGRTPERSARQPNHRRGRHPNAQVIHGERKRLALRSTTGANRSVFLHKIASKRRQVVIGAAMFIVTLLVISFQFIAGVIIEDTSGKNDPNTVALSAISRDYIAKHRWYLLFEKSDYVSVARQEVSALMVSKLTFNPLSHQLTIQSSPRTAKATWQTGGSQYYLDEDGIIFTNPDLKRQPSLHIRDTKNVPVEPGKPALAISVLQIVDEAETTFKTLSITTERYEVGGDPRSISVVLSEPKITIKISTTESAAPQIKDASIGLNGLAKQGKAPQEYLDVRTPGKIFWQ